jgi:hypothetical protein
LEVSSKTFVNPPIRILVKKIEVASHPLAIEVKILIIGLENPVWNLGMGLTAHSAELTKNKTAPRCVSSVNF